MYICRRSEPDLIDMTDGDEVSSPQDQWWKINYATSGEMPVTVEVRRSFSNNRFKLTNIENYRVKRAGGWEEGEPPDNVSLRQREGHELSYPGST